MPSQVSPIPWFGDLEGVAYRYYDLRMTVIPLVADVEEFKSIWRDTIYWWLDSTIKIRFVESKDDYWFIMGSETKKPDNNLSFYKILKISDNYRRFKEGHDGEAYMRLGTYTRKGLANAKDNDLCSCDHDAVDHDRDAGGACLYDGCDCKIFSTFQVILSRRKKTVTNIAFIKESDEDVVREDPLVWNCLYTHRYSLQGKD